MELVVDWFSDHVNDDTIATCNRHACDLAVFCKFQLNRYRCTTTNGPSMGHYRKPSGYRDLLKYNEMLLW